MSLTGRFIALRIRLKSPSALQEAETILRRATLGGEASVGCIEVTAHLVTLINERGIQAEFYRGDTVFSLEEMRIVLRDSIEVRPND